MLILYFVFTLMATLSLLILSLWFSLVCLLCFDPLKTKRVNGTFTLRYSKNEEQQKWGRCSFLFTFLFHHHSFNTFNLYHLFFLSLSFLHHLFISPLSPSLTLSLSFSLMRLSQNTTTLYSYIDMDYLLKKQHFLIKFYFINLHHTP